MGSALDPNLRDVIVDEFSSYNEQALVVSRRFISLDGSEYRVSWRSQRAGIIGIGFRRYPRSPKPRVFLHNLKLFKDSN